MPASTFGQEGFLRPLNATAGCPREGLPRRATSAVSRSPGLATVLSVVLASALTMACGAPSSSPPPDSAGDPQGTRHDVHSYANPTQARVRHVDLDLEVRFDERILRGIATLTIDHVQPDADTIVLDTRDLTIHRVETSTPNAGTWPATFQVGSADPVLGAPLTVFLPPDTTHVSVQYETSPDASGVQWLASPQTAGKQHPFMFTQSQAIHARSWDSVAGQPWRTGDVFRPRADAAGSAGCDERRQHPRGAHEWRLSV